MLNTRPGPAAVAAKNGDPSSRQQQRNPAAPHHFYGMVKPLPSLFRVAPPPQQQPMETRGRSRKGPVAAAAAAATAADPSLSTSTTATTATGGTAASSAASSAVPIKATCSSSDGSLLVTDGGKGSSRVPENAARNWNWRRDAAAAGDPPAAPERLTDDDDDEEVAAAAPGAAAAVVVTAPQEESGLRGFSVGDDDSYIRTPGHGIVYLNEFTMSVDLKNRPKMIPQLADFAHYAQDVYHSWRQQESLLGSDIKYCFGADHSSDFERYRIYSVVWLFRTTHSLQFSPAVCHYAVFSLNRAFKSLRDSGQKISLPLFFGIISASLRVAVKHDESFDRQHRVKYDARDAFAINADLGVNIPIDKINEIENRLVGLLNSPLLPPSSLDFLDRFIKIGEWPESVSKDARPLAHYCLDLSLFSGSHALNRMGAIVPSLLAGAALALSIKIVGAMSGSRYEPWPTRLCLYTGYSMADLSNTLSGLCYLLRHKPEQAAILEQVHEFWGKQTWQ